MGFWDTYNQSVGNLGNVLSQNRQIDANRELKAREIALDNQKYADVHNQNALKMQAEKEKLDREKGAEHVKTMYALTSSIKDQQSLNNVIDFAAKNYGPEVAANFPKEWNQDTANKVGQWKEMQQNVLTKDLGFEKVWKKDQNGNESYEWVPKGQTPNALAQGQQYSIGPNEKVDVQALKNKGGIEQQKAQDAAAMEREKYSGGAAMDRLKYQEGAETSRAKLKNDIDLKKSQIDRETQLAKEQLVQVSKAKENAFDKEQKLGDIFQKFPEVKAWSDVSPQIEIMRESLAEAKKNYGDKWSSQSYADQGLIMTFNKLLDPSSTVREGEYARTTQDMRVVAQLRAKWDKVLQGGVLEPGEREAMVRMADRFSNVYEKKYNNRYDQITKLAKTYGYNPENVVRFSQKGSDANSFENKIGTKNSNASGLSDNAMSFINSLK
jgi:hypothetical protein